eukprot:455733_1
MSGLSREVLKWIQGLDLSYSVRNVRRDFSNGFMVAEILSRYYPHDIEMHSFDNGCNINTKQDNWNQLKKFFNKIEFEYNTEEIMNIIKCDTKSQSVKLLINRLYQTITNKKLRAPPKIKENKLIPPYAFNTASKTVTEEFRGKNVENSDINTTKQQARNIINQHQELQFQQKTLRGNSVKKHLLSSGRVARRTVKTTNNEMQNVTFIKDVEVKKVTESLLTLRNSTSGLMVQQNAVDNEINNNNNIDIVKQSPVHNTNSNTNEILENIDPNIMTNNNNIANNNMVMVIQSIDEIFQNCIQFCIRNEIIDIDFFSISLNEEETQSTTITLFFEMFYNFNNCEICNKLINIIECMQTEFISSICQSAVCSPKQFWRIMNIFCKGFDILDESSILFDKWLCFGKEFVKILIRSDNGFIFDLFCDFGLKSFISILSLHASKRKYIFEFIYLFLNTDQEKIIFLKRLQKEFNINDNKFIENIAMFIECDNNNNNNNNYISQQLLDIYIYYSISGLTHISPKTRAA